MYPARGALPLDPICCLKNPAYSESVKSLESDTQQRLQCSRAQPSVTQWSTSHPVIKPFTYLHIQDYNCNVTNRTNQPKHQESLFENYLGTEHRFKPDYNTQIEYSLPTDHHIDATNDLVLYSFSSLTKCHHSYTPHDQCQRSSLKTGISIVPYRGSYTQYSPRITAVLGDKTQENFRSTDLNSSKRVNLSRISKDTLGVSRDKVTCSTLCHQHYKPKRWFFKTKQKSKNKPFSNLSQPELNEANDRNTFNGSHSLNQRYISYDDSTRAINCVNVAYRKHGSNIDTTKSVAARIHPNPHEHTYSSSEFREFTPDIQLYQLSAGGDFQVNRLPDTMNSAERLDNSNSPFPKDIYIDNHPRQLMAHEKMYTNLNDISIGQKLYSNSDISFLEKTHEIPSKSTHAQTAPLTFNTSEAPPIKSDHAQVTVNPAPTVLLTALTIAVSYFWVGPLVVVYWCNTWGLLNHYVYSSNLKLSGWVCAACGYGVFLFLGPLQGRISTFVLSLRRNWVKFLLSRLYTYVIAAACVAQWRGLWTLQDIYLHVTEKSVSITLSVAASILLVFRCYRSTLGPPVLVLPDWPMEEYFTVTTFFRTKAGSVRHISDTALTVLLVNSLVITVWRTTWELLDLLLYPCDPAKSALLTLAGSYGLAAILLCVQPSITHLSRRLDSAHWLWKLVLEDIFALLLSLCQISHWRGFWLLMDEHDNFRPGSLWVCHGASFILLAATMAAQSIVVKGCTRDGELSEGNGVCLNVSYVQTLARMLHLPRKPTLRD